jgi:hypothetical protein
MKRNEEKSAEIFESAKIKENAAMKIQQTVHGTEKEKKRVSERSS